MTCVDMFDLAFDQGLELGVILSAVFACAWWLCGSE
jgi:hypothetical protein